MLIYCMDSRNIDKHLFRSKMICLFGNGQGVKESGGSTRRSLLGMSSKRDGRIQPSVTSQPPRFTDRMGGTGGDELLGVAMVDVLSQLELDEIREVWCL